MAIHERAMIVQVNISQWTARKYDKKVSDRVELEYAAKDSGRWNKILVAKDRIQKIQRIANAAREWIYDHTLPWGNNGDRLLTVAEYDRFIIHMTAFQEDFTREVSEFIKDYPILVEDAERRLGEMFDEKDYPRQPHIRTKFSFRFSFSPVPHAGDVRIELENGEVDRIKKSMKENLNQLQKQAYQNMWQRVYDNVSHMAARLSNADAIFRDTLVENLKDLADVLGTLNYNGDQELEAMRKRIQEKLTHVEPEDLRTNRVLRTIVAQEAGKIVAEIEGTRKLKL